MFTVEGRPIQLCDRLPRRSLMKIGGLALGVHWIKSREDLRRWMAPLWEKDWQVHCQAPPAHCEGPDAVLKYLAQYVSGVAIHDGRMISDDGERVTFMAKNYRRKTRGPVPVSGEEFVNRFLLHILPPRFRRIRYSGLLAPHHREEKLALCRSLLPEPDTSATNEEQPEHEDAEQQGKTDHEKIVRFSQLSCHPNRLIPQPGRPPRTRIHPRILLRRLFSLPTASAEFLRGSRAFRSVERLLPARCRSASTSWPDFRRHVPSYPLAGGMSGM